MVMLVGLMRELFGSNTLSEFLHQFNGGMKSERRVWNLCNMRLGTSDEEEWYRGGERAGNGEPALIPI